MTAVYTLARVPGATNTVEWETICHKREPMVYISYERTYEKSRWVTGDRKRPFTVYWKRGGSVSRIGVNAWSRHATLAAAEKAARKLAKEGK